MFLRLYDKFSHLENNKKQNINTGSVPTSVEIFISFRDIVATGAGCPAMFLAQTKMCKHQKLGFSFIIRELVANRLNDRRFKTCAQL